MNEFKSHGQKIVIAESPLYSAHFVKFHRPKHGVFFSGCSGKNHRILVNELNRIFTSKKLCATVQNQQIKCRLIIEKSLAKVQFIETRYKKM
ncbi:hypothetical protein HMPREF0645_0612 [Hallella bergensis DSM 17361]|uniref:Uncharacterized protein n=1 Tax=Hallella bergensis DSM 17361 TaxID=585502 RepID=D1PUH7_9BACT|nr:hypothetical protein HMPREF0645_0612 [Hallella bergensis DSM 17361]